MGDEFFDGWVEGGAKGGAGAVAAGAIVEVADVFGAVAEEEVGEGLFFAVG